MVLPSWTGLPALGWGLALPMRVVIGAGALAEEATHVAVETTSVGVRTVAAAASAMTDTALNWGRVARRVVAATGMAQRAGNRLSFRLHLPAGASMPDRHSVEDAAKRIAHALIEHPDVLVAYWDGGAARLVVQLTEEAVTDQLSRRVSALATKHGLAPASDEPEELTHPGDVRSVRTAATALALDAAGIATAVTGRVVRLKRSPKWISAAATVVSEDPRIRGALQGWLGTAGTEVVLAGVNAAARGLGQSPTELVVDAALRTGQLVGALARVAASDAAGDVLCTPATACLSGDHPVSRPARVTAAQDYASSAVTTSLIAAAVTLWWRRDGDQAAQAVLVASPRAARYGPAAYRAALSCVLADQGMLLGGVERLGLLEMVDTVVLHPSALRGTTWAVVEVHPSTGSWDHDRLWQAATTALSPATSGRSRPDRSALELRPVPDQRCGETGLMIASQDGAEIGTVLVDWELDPLAEAVLDAARRAGLHVMVVDDPLLGDFTALADEVADPGEPFVDLVRRLQDGGRVVLSIARIRTAPGTADGPPVVAEDGDVLAGLLGSDLSVAVADQGCAVVRSADVVAVQGLIGVWRLLAAVPAAQTVSRRSVMLAQAGAALSGLLMATRAPGRRGIPWGWGSGLSPVNAATAAALVNGYGAAVRVGLMHCPDPRPRIDWHALTGDQAVSQLTASPQHQRDTPARAPGSRPRVNQIVAGSPLLKPVWLSGRLAQALRAELNDPLIPVLAVGAAASAIVGSTLDAVLVASAMGINACTGAVQRLRAEQALAALTSGQQQQARRVSDATTDHTRIIDAIELTLGDIIQLGVGDVVPADGRLLKVCDLEVDESSLTGESVPVSKEVTPTPGAAISDRRCMVFEGTTVVAGQATAVVVATGQQTEAGRAVRLATRHPPAAGVQTRLHELTSKALPWTLLGGATVTGLSLLRGRPLREAISGGVAVAVAAVPEGLPMVATVAQLAAARRLTRCGVLVRTPRTLEALGRVNTVCFDKTGTLTENRLQVVRLTTPEGAPLERHQPAAVRLLRAAARACPHHPEHPADHAHATDEAVLAAAPCDEHWTQRDGQPFEASRGYAAAVGTGHNDGAVLVVKGAPEIVLPRCVNARADSSAVVDGLASEGLRVLAIAQRRLDSHQTADIDKPLENLELLGFLALADTPRASSPSLITGLRAAGISPVMLTGDHPHTARAIAIDLGWPPDTVVVTGQQLATLDRTQRAQLLRDAGVIARVAPEQKLQVIEALQAAQRIVAMVGDGTNDAAAIRAADVGVGIAVRGSDAARNAADLVLTTDDLTVLVDTIAQGRTLWHSVADAISILIGGNAGEVGFTVLGTLLSGTSPLSVRQLLLVNLLTDMFPAMAVAVTPSDTATTAQPTSPVGTATLHDPLTRQIRHRGIITALAASTAWAIGNLTPGTARRTSTMALCGVVGAQLTQTLIGRHHSPLVLATTLGSAIALTLIVQTPLVSHFFGCTPLGPVAWSGIAAAITIALLGPTLLPLTERLLNNLPNKI